MTPIRLQIVFDNHDEQGSCTFTAEGRTLLAALGKLDEQVNEAFNATLGDDCVFAGEFADAHDWLSQGKPYRRTDFSDPEQDFTLTVLP